MVFKHKNASQASGHSNCKYLAIVNSCVPYLLPYLKNFFSLIFFNIIFLLSLPEGRIHSNIYWELCFKLGTE